MFLSISKQNFTVKPKDELKDLTYETRDISPIILFDKVKSGYCFQNHYNFDGEHQFKGKGVKANNYIGSYVVSIDIDHQKESMRETLSKLLIQPTFCYETFSNKVGDYCYRFCYCFNDELKGKAAYTEAYRNICIKNNIEDLFDKHSADAYHYMNGTTTNADAIYYGCTYNVNDFISNDTLKVSSASTPLRNNINANETFNKELMKDIKKQGYAKVVEKYANVYRHYESTSIPKVNDDTPLIDLKDFYEIKRIWTKNNDGKCHTTRLVNGQRRRYKIFYNLCIRRLICNDLSLDELLFAAAWEMTYYIDNTDKNDKITLGQLMSIAYNAYTWDLKNFNYVAPRKQMVNYKYCKKHNISKRKIASMLGHVSQTNNKENKKEIFFKFYNDNLTIDENIEYFKDKTGLTVGKSTVKRWRKEELLTRCYTKVSSASALIRDNINANETLSATLTKVSSASALIRDNINANETLSATLTKVSSASAPLKDNINGFGTLYKSETKRDTTTKTNEPSKEALQGFKCNGVNNDATQTGKKPHRANLGHKIECA